MNNHTLKLALALVASVATTSPARCAFASSPSSPELGDKSMASASPSFQGTQEESDAAQAGSEAPRQIETLIASYELALETRDASAYMALWPSADEKQIRRNFRSIRRQEITISHVEVELSGETARIGCQFGAFIVDTRGETHEVPQGPITISVQHAKKGWVITGME